MLQGQHTRALQTMLHWKLSSFYLFYDAQIQTLESEFPCNRTFLRKQQCHTRKTVSTTCPQGRVDLEYYWDAIQRKPSFV